MAQALRRKLDGRQGILDFMGQTSGDLAPGIAALGLDQRGDVVDDQQGADRFLIIAHEGGAATEQFLPAGGSHEADFLLPGLGVGLGQRGFQPFHELLQVRVGAGKHRQRPAHVVAEVRMKHGVGGLVGGLKNLLSIQTEHRRGQIGQHGFQIGMLALDFQP